MVLLKTYALDKLHSLTQGKALHHACPQPKTLHGAASPHESSETIQSGT